MQSNTKRTMMKGIRKPLQSRSAENLRDTAAAGGSGGGGMTGSSCICKSRSANDMASEVTDRCRETGRQCKRRQTMAAGHVAGRHESPPVELVLCCKEKEEVVERMHTEFGKKRKAVLNGLPLGVMEGELDTFLENYSCKTVSKLKDHSVRLLFPSPDMASEQLPKLSVARYDGHKLTALFGHPDSLLFVGNLSLSYSRNDLLKLFNPHGQILRCFVVCSPTTGLGKGYGFVEYLTRDQAASAKLALATKVVGQRSLRVDFADNGMQTCEDLQSRTLFVDRLPKGFADDETLRDIFSDFGIVNFCQVALTATGASRGFAFIDMSTWLEAEEAQENCNGVLLGGNEIRVSFGMPCRPGACILQHKNSVSIPFINGKPYGSTLHLCQKENVSLQGNGATDFCQQPSYLQFSLLPPSTTSSAPYKPHSFQLDATQPEFVPDPCFISTSSSSSLRPPNQCNKLGHSYSAPDISTHPPPPPSSSSDQIATSSSSASLPTECSSSNLVALRYSRKRCASSLDSAVEESLMALYDRPYIGQHQQGIPYTHPLKRMKTSPTLIL